MTETVEPEAERDTSEDECASKRTVQVGNLSAIDLQCQLQRWQHRDKVHMTGRMFGDVRMSARWPGSFEEPVE